MTRQARLPVMITKFGNLMITARPCLLSYYHDPGVSGQSLPGQSTINRQRKGRGPTAQSRPGAVGVQVNQRPSEHHQSARAVEPGRMAPPPGPGQVEGPACLFLPVFPAGATIRASGRRV
jgi:hypothetical protein